MSSQRVKKVWGCRGPALEPKVRARKIEWREDIIDDEYIHGYVSGIRIFSYWKRFHNLRYQKGFHNLTTQDYKSFKEAKQKGQSILAEIVAELVE